MRERVRTDLKCQKNYALPPEQGVKLGGTPVLDDQRHLWLTGSENADGRSCLTFPTWTFKSITQRQSWQQIDLSPFRNQTPSSMSALKILSFWVLPKGQERCCCSIYPMKNRCCQTDAYDVMGCLRSVTLVMYLNVTDASKGTYLISTCFVEIVFLKLMLMLFKKCWAYCWVDLCHQ